MRKLSKIFGVALIATSMLVSVTGCSIDAQLEELQTKLAAEEAAATQTELKALQEKLNDLIASNENDAATIESLNTTIDKLNAKINKLNADLLAANTSGMTAEEKTAYEATIANLSDIITQLQQQIADLIEANTATIWTIKLNTQRANSQLSYENLKNSFDINNGRITKENEEILLYTKGDPISDWFIGKAHILTVVKDNDDHIIYLCDTEED